MDNIELFVKCGDGLLCPITPERAADTDAAIKDGEVPDNAVVIGELVEGVTFIYEDGLYLVVPRVEVTSSNIASVGYHDGKLFVEFRRSGAVYEYRGVPEYVYHELINAESVGKFFHRNIKNAYQAIRRV